jgi:hypothetical protein
LCSGWGKEIGRFDHLRDLTSNKMFRIRNLKLFLLVRRGGREREGGRRKEE